MSYHYDCIDEWLSVPEVGKSQRKRTHGGLDCGARHGIMGSLVSNGDELTRDHLLEDAIECDKAGANLKYPCSCQAHDWPRDGRRRVEGELNAGLGQQRA